jgi:UDP-N-acetylmuramoylalanine--D-glutamate ligase
MITSPAPSVERDPRSIGGRRVLVTGAGRSGLAAAAALLDDGAEVTITDDRAEALAAAPEGARAVPGLTEVPAGTALVVTSPGWPPHHPLLRAALAAGTEVIGEPELAWRWALTRLPSPPIWLAVTGTNGKTTTVGMLAEMLVAGGVDAVACGNVGYPVITAVREGHAALAVELSSFQLHWSRELRPAAGCVLNVAEDHLDWHGSMAAYAAAKARVLTGPLAAACVDDPGAAELLRAAPAARKIGITLREPEPGQLGIAGGDLVDRAFGAGVALARADSIRPAGPHGYLDALAAAALARAHGLDPAAVRAGLAAFRPAAHRGGVVGEHGGVAYVDDSKATNPHAAAASLAGYPRVVWIAGGLLKGASVDELVAGHAHRLSGVVLIGKDRSALADALRRHAPDVPVRQVIAGDDQVMTEAVRLAADLARPGEVVLLAPAAASFDQFRDYGARGKAFAEALTALPAGPGHADPEHAGPEHAGPEHAGPERAGP